MGIDLGTSSLKTIIVNEAGNVKALCHRDYTFDSPRGGYAEQDPDTWWKACCETVREALAACGAPASEIVGVSFSGQMHGLVMLDSEYRVVRPAILHCDARSDEQVEELRGIFGEAGVQKLIMNPVYTGFLLPSLLWVRRNEPENYEKIRYVCLPKDYLKFRMTGELSSDYSDASATLAFDIKNGAWSDTILKQVDVPSGMFPRLYGTTENTGFVCRQAAQITGLSEKTVVAAGGGDQIMQSIGNGMVRPGAATANIGSSGQVCFQIDRPVLNPQLNTNMFCGFKKGSWILFGATMTAGLSLEWWHRIIGDVNYEQLNREVDAVQPGSGGVVFLPYLNGERTPHVNPNLSGMFMGVNIGTTRAHMTRAVMEGVAFSLMQCIEICGSLGFKAESLVASGGGARSKPWLQLQADIYDIPLRISETKEQAGMGAAIAAGVGAGIYRDLEEGCKAAVCYKDEIIVPDAQRHKIYSEYYELYKEVYASSKGVLQKAALMGRK
jgi:xylulokinase